MRKLFMVEFELPGMLTREFVRLIPKQRDFINELLAEGKIKSYSLAADRTLLWVVFSAESEFEVLETIAQFPLSEFMIPEIQELAFHNAQDTILQFSMN